ncbi:phosphate binding protein [Oleiphilus messinensis]|uniref:Phosphate binding protein n=2 Tax=Oleiphilus messinensis TaxID=141451 RepID=A0A1Y0I584_9GAMM|nr:phosphate binding protein [Oleiphilus messinensis]
MVRNRVLRCLAGLFTIVFVMGLSACGGSQTEKLVLTGSSTVAPLASEIARAFEQLHPETRIDVQTGGSSRGINDARNDLADIGMVSRALKSNESDLTAQTIAWDGITLILNSSNPVQLLNRSQVIDIYTKKITNWSEVGGPDQPVVVVNKAEGRSTLELFLKFYQLKGTEIKADIIIGDNQQGLKTVSGNPFAIGYVSIGAANYEKEQGAPIRILPVNGVDGTLSNVEKGLFPISRPLNLVTRDQSNPLAQQFIAFAQSSEVAELVARQFFVPAHAN